MKKFLILIILCLTFSVMNVKAVTFPKETNHEKIVIYFFRGEGCGYCHNALNYFNEIDQKYDKYVTFKVLETFNNANNNALMKYLKEKDNYQDGVPFFVIADQGFLGFNNEQGESILAYALEEYQNKDYQDSVKSLLSDYKTSTETIKEALNIKEETITQKEPIIEEETTKDETIINEEEPKNDLSIDNNDLKKEVKTDSNKKQFDYNLLIIPGLSVFLIIILYSVLKKKK